MYVHYVIIHVHTAATMTTVENIQWTWHDQCLRKSTETAWRHIAM